MIFNQNKHLVLHSLRAWSIARRYLVTNGFDGALTMLGMVTGFHASGMTTLPVAISACLGAAVALFISGLSSSLWPPPEPVDSTTGAGNFVVAPSSSAT